MPAPPSLTLCACALAGAAPLVAESIPAGPERPDIVFILTDDQRWDLFSFLGHPIVRTPHLDALRARGAHFPNAFCTTSICSPSRASFLTGCWAHRHGVIDNQGSEYDPAVTPTVAHVLRGAGYRTALIGKWHQGEGDHPRDGFDHWLSFAGQGVYFDPVFNINGRRVPETGYVTDLLTDHAVRFIREQDRAQPYFLMLGHKAVHEPFEPAPRHRGSYAGAVLAEPASYRDDFGGKAAWQRRFADRDWAWDWRTRDFERERVPEIVPAPPWQPPRRPVDQMRCLDAVDESLGRIVAALEERGTLGRTLIVFAGDNGYFHQEHRRHDKRVPYEEALRIPLLVCYPGRIPAGSTESRMVLNVDLAPTLLHYAGLPIPPSIQGSSWHGLFEDADSAWRTEFLHEYFIDLVHSIPHLLGLRTERWKLIRHPGQPYIDELYDLATDPVEMTNLAVSPDHAGILGDLRERLAEQLRVTGYQSGVKPRVPGRRLLPAGPLLDWEARPEGVLDRLTGVPVPALAAATVRTEADGPAVDLAEASVPDLPDPQRFDPSAGPFRIEAWVRAASDGAFLTHAGRDFGWKLVFQDGRPGFSVRCVDWMPSWTTLDAPESALGRWIHLEAVLDWNVAAFAVDGKLVGRVDLPVSFKRLPDGPLRLGAGAEPEVYAGSPSGRLNGAWRRLRLSRGPDSPAAPDPSHPPPEICP